MTKADNTTNNPRQRDMVDYQCVNCHQVFQTQYRRIKSEGNWCVSCKARLTCSLREYSPLSDEQKQKLAESHKGKPGYWTGKKMSESHRQRLSESHKGERPARRVPRVDPSHRKLREQVHDCCSGMVRRILKIRNEAKVRKTFEYLGYTKSEFVAHIEAQFTEGMAWSNYGEWQVDHITPVAEFVRQGILDIPTINALVNLQPLWKIDNIKKGDKVINHDPTG